MSLLKKIQGKTATIGIIGMGYVGLPLTINFLRAGFKVVGFDSDANKVKALNRGQSYIKHIPASLLAPYSSRFSATTDASRLKEPDIIIICVPTPLTENREPDMRYVEKAARDISQNFKGQKLISLESTTYPGTTEELILPIMQKNGRVIGKDFYLVFSPEREDPGNSIFSVKNIPKVVGGITGACLKHGVALYSQIVERVIPVSSTQTAESTKLLENIYRSVNIALVNEMKMLFDRMGINIWEVIEASKTKPFGFQPFYPGPGLGGHCIPVDPFYLTWKARQYDFATRFIELAGEINTSMPYYVISKTMEALNKKGKGLHGAKVLVLGVAYKKDIDDLRESPALKIIRLLQEKGAVVIYNDPYIPEIGKLRHYKFSLISQKLTAKLLKSTDITLILTNHTEYDYAFIVKNARIVVDTRNAVPKPYPNVVKA
ncbi:MAG: nucleotide sugar dehydrogenase [Candidatus Ratteibacteria bacterium]|jgi:UDP-N-acetyl-D-glucosamine dehydrogenase